MRTRNKEGKRREGNEEGGETAEEEREGGGEKRKSVLSHYVESMAKEEMRRGSGLQNKGFHILTQDDFSLYWQKT